MLFLNAIVPGLGTGLNGQQSSHAATLTLLESGLGP